MGETKVREAVLSCPGYVGIWHIHRCVGLSLISLKLRVILDYASIAIKRILTPPIR